MMEIKQWTFSSGVEAIGEVVDYHDDKIYVTNIMKIYHVADQDSYYSAMIPFMHGTINEKSSSVVELNHNNIISTCVPSDEIKNVYFGIVREELNRKVQNEDMDDEEKPKSKNKIYH
jgi:hypothetical protein